ncbi:MAG: SpoIIE family protein phosphatase [Chromatiaceae bacterium]|nr:SpoIIE family protein phosphatase [Chromatiaceae bacterium]
MPESETVHPAGSADFDLISRHALFQGVAPETLGPLVRGCELRVLAHGDVLLTPGQRNRSLFLLLDGQLKVRLDRVDSEEGFLIVPGECAGEISAIDCGVATAFVVAAAPSRLLVLSESDIWEGLFRVPEIARNFMRLFADRFRARNEAIQKALEQQLRYEHIQKELAIAQEIQLGMLPHELNLWPEIEVAAEMTPARQVGGDFYDVFPVGPNACCLAIGDVSGKGVPAALFMVRTMALLRAEVLKDQPVNVALAKLNELLCADNPTCMFATLIAGIIDRRSGVFTYATAGHDAVLVGASGGQFQPLPPPRGILAGLDKDATYDLASVSLGSGDVLVMYTDGVTEAMNADHRMFTLARLMDCLNTKPASSADGLARRVSLAVKDFTAGTMPSDDLTMVILRYLGAE